VHDGQERRAWRRLAVAPVAAVQLVIAAVAASQPVVAVGLIGGLVMLVAVVVTPILVMLSVFPATFAYWRVGPASIDMSVTDALTLLGVLASLPFVPWRSPALRRIMVATAAYCAVLMVTVVVHPAQRSLVEVFHQASLVCGTMFIGAALARLGRVRLALRAFLLAGAAISLTAVLDTLAHRLRPAYPFGIQKNDAGGLLTMGLVILLTASDRVGWSRRAIGVLSVLLIVGLAASESRGAALALIAVFALHLLRQRRVRGTSRIMRMAPLLLVASLLLIGISVLTYVGRDLNPQTAKFNSVNTRVNAYSGALEQKWEPNLVFGAGLKWFNAPGETLSTPHNLVIGQLSETGIIGLLALIGLLWVVLRTMRTSTSDLGEAGYLVVVARILEGMVDIFWVAGPATLPFLVVGLVVGDESDAAVGRRASLAAASR
jgi:polysaccharide biosynthesis protein PslJ